MISARRAGSSTTLAFSSLLHIVVEAAHLDRAAAPGTGGRTWCCPASMPSIEKLHDLRLFGLRPEGRDDGMQRPHPGQQPGSPMPPQRIDFGQGNVRTTSGTISPITSIAARPGFSITAT